MSTIQVTIDGAAAVIAAAELRDRQQWHRGRSLLLAALRTMGEEPSEAEVIDSLWAKMLGKVAENIETALYPPTDAPCRCSDPVCPKVHPVDMAVPA